MKAGTKVPDGLFGLELYVADDIHRYKQVSRRCEGCRLYKAIAALPGAQDSLLEHLFFEHNVRQKDLVTRDGKLHDFVSCPDCGRGMENFSWGGWVTKWRCRHCGYEWKLERRNRFDPKQLAREEKKAAHRSHLRKAHHGRYRGSVGRRRW